MRYNTKGYKPSHYNIFIPLKRGAIAYNCMGGIMQVWNEREQAIYDDIAIGKNTDDVLILAGNERYLSTVMEKFLAGRFLILKSSDEKKLFHQALSILRGKQDGFGLTIAPTMACNFACDYCFQGRHEDGGAMESTVREELLSFVRAKLLGKKHFSVAWYGGEPLLAMPVIEALSVEFITYCESHKINYDASVVTNGYFLTKENIDLLRRCKVSVVQVTLDGGRTSHDSRRHLKGGGATFDRIVDQLVNLALCEDIRISVRVNIDRRNAAEAEKLITNLAEKGLSGKDNFSMYFAAVDSCTEDCADIAGEVMSKEEYGLLEAKLQRQAVETGLAKSSLPSRLFSLCGAILPHSFVVLPNGDLHKCWNTVADAQQKVGNIKDAVKICNNTLYKDWITKPLIRDSKCYECPILANCAGGCANKSADQAAASCISLRENIKDIILLYAIESRQVSMGNLPEALVNGTFRLEAVDDKIGAK